jgi:hypothetical protein
MDKRPDSKEGTPPVEPAVNIEAEELIRDWELLFLAFLLFGLVRLVWLYLYRPERSAFHLGLSCGFAFSGAWGASCAGFLGPPTDGTFK